VRGVDRDAARFFFRCIVNLVVAFGFAAKFLRQYRCNRRGQRGLAVINVANRAYIHVRLGPLKLAFCHFKFPSKRTIYIIT